MSASVEINHRIVIAELFHAGHKVSEIIRDTGYGSTGKKAECDQNDHF